MIAAAGPASVYVFGATLGQRQMLAAMIKDTLAGLQLLSDTARVEVKRSTHLYVFDDRLLNGEPGSDKPSEIEFEHANPFERSNPLELPWLQAGERAAGVIGALDRLFARPEPGLPPFLWPRLKPRFDRTAPGRIVSGGKPHHWFVGYELLMQPPKGGVNGIRGAFMEFRLLPLVNGGWRLLLLHIRFPLLGQAVATRYWSVPGSKGDGGRDKPAGPKDAKSLKLPLSAGLGPLTLPAQGRPPLAPEAEPVAPAAAATPPMCYVLPVEGSNLLAPYYAFAGEQGEQFAPATPESALILIDQQRPGGLLLLKAVVAPATDAPWAFAWHYAGIEAGRPNRPAGGMVDGPVLVLPEGLYDVDLLVTKTVRTGPPEAGGMATVVLRARRMLSSDHAIVPVDAERAKTIVHTHGGDGHDEPRPPGLEPAAAHPHDA